MKNVLVINCSPVRNGATAKIVKLVSEQFSSNSIVKAVCIDDYTFGFCKGCRSCHTTARCVQSDDVDLLMREFERADVIVCVSPSYWADVPGQFKAFIDRCTPWCNTHEPHASLKPGKKGYAIAFRTGSGRKECDRIIESIEHFYGHLMIECAGHIGFTGIEFRDAVEKHRKEIEEFCREIQAEL
ncbi:MAG: flavodoxin family protein [Lachnospiraceae bacterium]|nr:flavodoxin family protein [Lachnospiraceae bacterium]